MALDVIVCDDSSFARKQLISTLPKSLVKNLYQAENGLDAVQLLRKGQGELLFLDLTMPVMDGYQVLETIKNEHLNVMTIVISADIQDEARKTILSYENVLAFLPKPLDQEKLSKLLSNYGLIDPDDVEKIEVPEDKTQKEDVSHNIYDSLREKLNIAAGITASRMAEVLNLFITMPVPQIRIKKGIDVAKDIVSWLNISDNENKKHNIIVSQGFVGEGVLGENLLYFSKNDINNYSHLVSDGELTDDQKVGIMIDLAGLMSGSIVRSLATQFNTTIDMNHPALVPNILISDFFFEDGKQTESPDKTTAEVTASKANKKDDEPFMPYNIASSPLKSANILCVEFNFDIKDRGMSIRLDILFTNSTVEKVRKIMEFV